MRECILVKETQETSSGYIYIYIYIYIYTGGGQKSGHPQKYSQFGVTTTGRTEIKKNHMFLECFLRDLFKMLLKY